MCCQAERIDLGEEVSYQFVKDILNLCLEAWNESVDDWKKEASSPELLLKELDEECKAGKTDEQMEALLENMKEQQGTVNIIFESVDYQFINTIRSLRK